MALPRALLSGLTAVLTVCGLAVDSSTAADRGHAPTRAALETVVERDRVPGAVARVEDGAGPWEGAAGVADRATGRPRSAGERFRIGSLTKPFVATVLLQLEAEGRLRLDDPVGRWLPASRLGGYGTAIGASRSTVTLRNLLGHTSGIPDYTAGPAVRRAYFSPAFLTRRWDTHTPQALARPALDREPLFPPGARWAYSNTNYLLAGMVIERVTGHSYAREIERRILRPLKLRDTSLPGTSTRIPGRHGRSYSTLHTAGPHPRVYDVTSLNPSLAGASGEMISSGRDLTRFARALVTGGLLPPRQLREMETTRPAGAAERYGLGLTERTLPCGVTLWGHEGTIHGSRTAVFTTVDGTHAAAFNVNGDWAGTRRLVDAEFCG
ncbi:beta-lactamase family protein [Streptomyces albus]|uniref:serine hydrolase domain-containing protein n=1 Tax=Streptomyces TaxID=1883 RepID=UPI0013B47C0B|nr:MULTISPECIES: serine hydrolase domain-containing protein [Streptomyces]MDI6408113.1 serine hydrolase domain-containing protein [Streptomyces albus]QID36373.1 beta-lactamase family protein [Streptomyces albus]